MFHMNCVPRISASEFNLLNPSKVCSDLNSFHSECVDFKKLELKTNYRKLEAVSVTFSKLD